MLLSLMFQKCCCFSPIFRGFKRFIAYIHKTFIFVYILLFYINNIILFINMLCEHNRRKSECKYCGLSFCQHNRKRVRILGRLCRALISLLSNKLNFNRVAPHSSSCGYNLRQNLCPPKLLIVQGLFKIWKLLGETVQIIPGQNTK